MKLRLSLDRAAEPKPDIDDMIFGSAETVPSER